MNYAIKATAMATGVSESCLRTWERRYGVPLPQRSDSGRRLYCDDDLEVVRRMVALIESGVPASGAAEAVRLEGDDPVVEAGESPEHPLIDLFVQKARAYDQGWLRRIIRDSVYSTGWPATLDRIVFPALRRLGEAWVQGSCPTTNEHFAVEILRCELAAEMAHAAEQRSGDAPIIMASPEGEAHELGLLSLALMLRKRSLSVIYLGARVPCSDLIEVIRQTRPCAVCLAATSAQGLASLHRAARRIVSKRVSVPLFLGGPALVNGHSFPGIPGIVLPQSLLEAEQRIVAGLNGRVGNE